MSPAEWGGFAPSLLASSPARPLAACCKRQTGERPTRDERGDFLRQVRATLSRGRLQLIMRASCAHIEPPSERRACASRPASPVGRPAGPMMRRLWKRSAPNCNHWPNKWPRAGRALTIAQSRRAMIYWLLKSCVRLLVSPLCRSIESRSLAGTQSGPPAQTGRPGSRRTLSRGSGGKHCWPAPASSARSSERT